MKNVSLKISAIVLCFVLALTSCKKESENNSNDNSLIVGHWTLAEFGEDSNNNSVVDQGEVVPAAMVGASGTVHFNSDKTFTGTITFGSQSSTETGTYSYSNNSLTLVTQTETSVIPVITLTNNRLVLRETSSSPAEWVIYTK